MPSAGIETHGMEAVPAALKTVRWADLFCIIVNFQLNAGQILVGGLSVAAGLPVWQAILAQTLGVALAFIPYVTMATAGVDHGIPGQAATRMAFGLRGAPLLPSLLRTIASIYWFAFQTIAGSAAITAVLDRWTGTPHSMLTTSLVFGVLQAVVAIYGYGSLKLLSRAALPVKLVLMGWMLLAIATHPDPHYAPHAALSFAGGSGGWLLFVAWLSSWVIAWLTMVTDAADFCRYSRSRRDMWIATMLAAILGGLFVSLLGAYAAGASQGAQPNAFALVAQISQGHFALLLLIVVILFDNWTINVLNLYTGGLSLLNLVDGLGMRGPGMRDPGRGGFGRLRATILVSAAGIALSAVPGFIGRYTGAMNLLGTVFAPMAGVLVGDYLLVRRMRLDVPALFQRGGAYWYWRGFNPVAIGWTVIGFGLYRLAVPASLPAPVVVFLLTLAGYVATTRLVRGPQPQTLGDSLAR